MDYGRGARRLGRRVQSGAHSFGSAAASQCALRDGGGLFRNGGGTIVHSADGDRVYVRSRDGDSRQTDQGSGDENGDKSRRLDDVPLR